MTKLEKLIEELCPNGVGYVKLNSICVIYDGTHQTPNYRDSGIPFISVENIGDIYNSTKYISLEDYNKYKIKPQINDVFMTRIGSIGKCAVFEKDMDLAYYVSLALIRPNPQIVNSRYLKHLIESTIGTKELRKRTLVNAVPIKINKDDIGKIKLPIPPLEVQAEIVRILDDYSTSVAALQQELEKELTARKKQYEYYRDVLFSSTNAPKYSITEIAFTYIGLVTTMTKHYVSNGVRLIHNSCIKENRFEFKEDVFLDEPFSIKNNNRRHKIDDVITVHTGDVGTSAIIDESLDGSLGFATIVSRIHDKDMVIPKYLCYYLNSHENKSNITSMIKGDRNNLNLKDFNKLQIPVPPLEEQERIVEILDRFDKLCNDISEGLPAEIEARRKQYEYYRDKLLTFKELTV